MKNIFLIFFLMILTSCASSSGDGNDNSETPTLKTSLSSNLLGEAKLGHILIN
tara:strand:- start:49 stop:207 length:159 start_codon:yes stop_codon:yes gene_type:complete